MRSLRSYYSDSKHYLFTERKESPKHMNGMCLTCIPTHLDIRIFWPLWRLSKNLHRLRQALCSGAKVNFHPSMNPNLESILRCTIYDYFKPCRWLNHNVSVQHFSYGRAQSSNEQIHQTTRNLHRWSSYGVKQNDLTSTDRSLVSYAVCHSVMWGFRSSEKWYLFL